MIVPQSDIIPGLILSRWLAWLLLRFPACAIARFVPVPLMASGVISTA